MKKILLSAIATVALSATAFAADLPVRTYTKAPPAVPMMTYNWTGCYVGGNLGGGWAQTNQTNPAQINGAVNNPPFNYGSSTGSNFVGGAQIGCDYQFAGNWVVGIQGMFDFGNIKSQQTLPDFPAFYMMNSTKNLFTVTGRVGYLFVPALLGYVKGGGAFAKTDYSVFGFGPPVFLSESALGISRSGWTVGGGLEWMFAPGWSVFGEFNYMDFGYKNINFVAAPGLNPNADVVRTRLQVDQFLAGVNYKFNFGGPVVAKY
jgi:outer membrane immunogenic protein